MITLEHLLFVNHANKHHFSTNTTSKLFWEINSVSSVPDERKRRVDMFHAKTPDPVKEHIVEDMTDKGGNIKILICTSAFGMGVNTKGITQIIHFGPPRSIESYIQECGRAGRDGEPSKCHLIYNGMLMLFTSDEMRTYVQNKESCRRRQLRESFEASGEEGMVGCQCCDYCSRDCICDLNHEVQLFDDLSMCIKEVKVRSITKSQKEDVEQILRNDLMIPTSSKLSLPTTLFSFNELQIQQVMSNVDKIFNLVDVYNYVEVWKKRHAVKILNTISLVFGDCGSLKEDDNDELEENFVEEHWQGLIVSNESEFESDPDYSNIYNDDMTDDDDYY
ncbi:uncharacterized protein [Clytia hemisphaerica]|uniref:uncharacterized protein n=1 Tax=Clytia hemisphaerica TaxID=252671 RepID=UPI0034D70ABB